MLAENGLNFIEISRKANMRNLNLTLNKKWFDMIASGEKKEEYREIKDYWTKRLTNQNSLFDNGEIKHFDTVTFKNGYSPFSPMMSFEVKEIVIAEGKPEWGAEKGAKYYVIRLGEKCICKYCQSKHGVVLNNEDLPKDYQFCALCRDCAINLNNSNH